MFILEFNANDIHFFLKEWQLFKSNTILSFGRTRK